MVMQRIIVKLISKGIFFLFLIILMTACAPGALQVTITPEEPVEVSPQPVETEPAETQIVSSEQSVVLLAADSETDPVVVSQIQAVLENLVSTSEHRLIIEENFSRTMITPDVLIVVLVGSAQDLPEIAAANAQVMFVAVGGPQAQPAENILVIGDSLLDQQHQAFMAGYLSALVSRDYKVAALIPSDADQTDRMLDAFITGVRFYCGICRPLFPPYNTFPQWEMLASENAVQGFQTSIDTLVNNGVEVLFVPQLLHSTELLAYLSELGVKVVSDASPDSPGNNWVGTVTTDPAAVLVSLWPEIIDGTDGVKVPSPIAVIDTGSGLLTEGRRYLFDEMAENLRMNLVLPESVP